MAFSLTKKIELAATGYKLSAEDVADVLNSGNPVAPQALIVMAGSVDTGSDEATRIKAAFVQLPKAQKIAALAGFVALQADAVQSSVATRVNFGAFEQLTREDSAYCTRQELTGIRAILNRGKRAQNPDAQDMANSCERLTKAALPERKFQIKLPSFMQVVEAVRSMPVFKAPELAM